MSDEPEFSFRLLLAAPELTGEQVKLIYDHVPDANLSQRDGRVHAGFDRLAPTFAEAVVSAIIDLERVLPSVPVIALEPDELVFMADIATRRNRSKESVSLLVEGRRGPGDFPAPAYVTAGHKLWRWSEVERWFDRYEGREGQDRHDAFVVAVNAVLAERRSLPQLRIEERESLRKLAGDRVPVAS